MGRIRLIVDEIYIILLYIYIVLYQKDNVFGLLYNLFLKKKQSMLGLFWTLKSQAFIGAINMPIFFASIPRCAPSSPVAATFCWISWKIRWLWLESPYVPFGEAQTWLMEVHPVKFGGLILWMDKNMHQLVDGLSSVYPCLSHHIPMICSSWKSQELPLCRISQQVSSQAPCAPDKAGSINLPSSIPAERKREGWSLAIATRGQMGTRGEIPWVFLP